MKLESKVTSPRTTVDSLRFFYGRIGVQLVMGDGGMGNGDGCIIWNEILGFWGGWLGNKIFAGQSDRVFLIGMA